MMDSSVSINLFNSSLETGVRSLIILVAAFPRALDLQRLIEMDYLVVHSGDVDGPSSLHAPIPMRIGELLVRRGIIEQGLTLMMSRGLIERLHNDNGFEYIAHEDAAPFISALSNGYSCQLKKRAEWAVNRFENTTTEELSSMINSLFYKWSGDFQDLNSSWGI